ncbi:MFS transporter [Candidatus Cyrtobacter comes]|uniref:MFS transporter n=1 Tax=Candidatus Cyrtobacter comes TaxID=675776 RepID=A0ABU5L7S9_9RICK|nr:MFS transporter [Candidatus Cyrtobacter comes]MDZ5762188.1 MFS transporter [Candidatus Cyrtobacter comes]
MFIFTVFTLAILTVIELESFTPGIAALQSEFGLSVFETQLSISINFLSYCICSIICGFLVDKYSKKHILCLGLLIFLLGSVMCSIAHNYPIFLLGRFLQGIGCSAPAVLAYVLLSDKYSTDEQTAIVGYLHGAMATTSSLSPVIGSYLTLYFGWRSNFIFLLMLCIVSLICSLFFIEDTKNQTKQNVNLGGYLFLLTSRKTLPFIMVISFFIVPYIVFIGIIPILYISDAGLEQQTFAYHPLSLAIAFGLVSFLSGGLIKRFGKKKCLYIGILFLAVHAILMICISIMRVSSPIIITLCELISSVAVVFPINILFPYAMKVSGEKSGMMSALMSAARLALSFIGLWVVGALHDGTVRYLGLWIAINISIGILCSLYIIRLDKNILVN